MSKYILILLLVNAGVITEVCYSQTNSGSERDNENLTGSLLIRADIDSFYVTINDNFKEVYHLTQADTISIEQGEQQVRIFQKYYKDLVTTIDVKPDTVTKIITTLSPITDINSFKYYSSYPRVFWRAPIIVKTDPDASLYIDGEYLGTGFGRIDSTGYFTIKSELPGGRIETETFYADESKRQTFFVKEIYHRPEKRKARYLSVLPGASQIYKGEKIKGYVLLGATLLGTGFAIKFHKNFLDKYNSFENTQTRYLKVTNPNIVYELGNLADKQLNEANKVANLRNGFIYGAIGTYIYSLVDGLIKPKIGYRENIKLDPYIEFDDVYRRRIGLSASVNF